MDRSNMFSSCFPLDSVHGLTQGTSLELVWSGSYWSIFCRHSLFGNHSKSHNTCKVRLDTLAVHLRTEINKFEILNNFYEVTITCGIQTGYTEKYCLWICSCLVHIYISIFFFNYLFLCAFIGRNANPNIQKGQDLRKIPFWHQKNHLVLLVEQYMIWAKYQVTGSLLSIMYVPTFFTVWTKGLDQPPLLSHQPCCNWG